MRQVVIDNPVLNSPYSEPTRHFRFDEEGITNEVIEQRRISSYFVPVAKPRKRGKLHIPTESGHRFRLKAATDSDSIRPAIPIESGHRFRLNPARESESIDAG